MYHHLSNLNSILSLVKTLFRNNPHYMLTWLFVRYARNRLQRLSSKKFKILAVPDETLEKFLRQCNDSKDYIDEASCALGRLDGTESDSKSKWYYVCSKVSHRKYKILVVSYKNCNDDRALIVSETVLLNLENTLGHKLEAASYFVMPAGEEALPFAAEARVSMILNPYDCSNDLTDSLLEAYFKVPRYLRAKDVFSVDVKQYAADFFYSAKNFGLGRVHFRVNDLRVKHRDQVESTGNGCYVLNGETTLVQTAHVHSYLPREFVESTGVQVDGKFCDRIEDCCIDNCPTLLEEPLHALQACVMPFLQKERKMKIRPVFLVKGAPGSGKFRLIRTLAKRNGLNFYNVDFGEVQSPSAAQTEAKLRIVMQNAKNSVPCVLKFSNIQIFGKNSEGQKDERIITAFSRELKKLNEGVSRYPLIVIATLESDDLDADIQRLFIECVSIEHPGQARRAEALSWLIERNGLCNEADLTKIAGLVSDFRLADLETLATQAAKIAYQLSSKSENPIPLVLTQSNFVEACENMQSIFNDRVGAPRIPKVHWDDIGGLAKLKHEIKRRIELPMSEALGLGRSGLLLYGPPGTGKTLLAKAVATECQLHFMSIKGPELLNMYVGQSEKNIRQVFERARAAAPCVIFFDELDSLAPNRGRSGDSGGVMDRVVSQLLAEMDGLESTGKVFIIGATNRPDLIDPALLRPGRFDKMLYVGIYSDRESQLSVLRAVTRRFALKDNGDELELLVDELPANLTGADLYAVCSDAWLNAVRRNILTLERINDDNKRKIILEKNYENGVVVELRDFVEAAKNIAPSVSNEELARYRKLEMELSSTR